MMCYASGKDLIPSPAYKTLKTRSPGPPVVMTGRGLEAIVRLCWVVSASAVDATEVIIKPSPYNL